MMERPPDRMCTRRELEQALRELGVQAGMILSVHSSLASIGWIPGGARSVVDALLSVLGPEGTLVMPAHCGDNSDPAYWRNPPVPEAWWPSIRSAMPPFDKATTPGRKMGAIADCFRAYPGVRRSDHPNSSFIALGPAAKNLLDRHDLDCSLGERSPNGALEQADAWILLLGVSYDRCTEMHLAEYRSACRTSFRQGAAIWRNGQAEFARYPELELNSDDFAEPGRILEESGLVRHCLFSGAELRLFRVRDAVRTATGWLSSHRLRRQGEEDRSKIMDYLLGEPEYNLFLIGDIENFGMGTDFQDVMAFEKNGFLDSVLLRYHRSYIPYSRTGEFEVEPLLAALDTPNLQVLSGKQNVLDRLKPYLTRFHWRYSYLMRLGRGELAEPAGAQPDPAVYQMRPIELEDIPSLIDFLMSIQEFANQGAREERINQMTKAFDKGSSGYYVYWKSGRIVASCGITARNSISAMIVAVATQPEERGLGLASHLVASLARDLLDQLHYLCLFYDNPSAGRIYRRLGFVDVGQWVIATPPDPMAAAGDKEGGQPC